MVAGLGSAFESMIARELAQLAGDELRPLQVVPERVEYRLACTSQLCGVEIQSTDIHVDTMIRADWLDATVRGVAEGIAWVGTLAIDRMQEQRLVASARITVEGVVSA